MATDEHLIIKVGQRIEVCEGSWMGRIGTVLEPGDEKSLVSFGDNGTEEWVINCTMSKVRDGD